MSRPPCFVFFLLPFLFKSVYYHIGTDRPMAAPVFCFSLMAAPRVVSGGRLLRQMAGYGEVALPDLMPGQVHELVLGYAAAELRPVNRAWLPLGPYLRAGDGTTHALPPLPAGVQGTFWAEFTTEDRQMEALIAPRILGVAQKAWESGDPGTGTMTGPELRALSRSYGPVFDAMGWDWYRGA
jgi:hypothetical protein